MDNKFLSLLSNTLKDVNKEIDKDIKEFSPEERAKFNKYRAELNNIATDNCLTLEQKQAKILETQKKYGY